MSNLVANPTYSFLDVLASITSPLGSFQLGSGAGIAKEGITIEMIEDKDNLLVGADGTLMHSLRASDAAYITVRILKTSPVNQKLSALYNAQKATSLLWGQNVIVVTNPVIGDVESLIAVAFRRSAVNTYAEDAGLNEWQFVGRRESQLGSGTPVLAA